MDRKRAARLLFQLPRQSRLFRALQPANNWDWNEVLLNKVFHQLEIIAWQKTKDAQKKIPRNMPKQFVPEFLKVVQPDRELNKDVEVLEVDELKALLSRPRK